MDGDRSATEEVIGALLDRVTERLGEPVPVPIRAALRAVPRHPFLPAVVWRDDGAGGHDRCDRSRDPDRWWDAAYSDVPLVTGFTTASDGSREPSSVATTPSVLVRNLADLDARPGHRVLEIGAGTGFVTALLAHLVGPQNVTSVETAAGTGAGTAGTESAAASGGGPAADPGARSGAEPRSGAGSCSGAGESGDARPLVVRADGTDGWGDRAPYDRLLSTCAVRRVPRAWLEQLAPGGRLVVPWVTAWCTFGTLLATKQDDGSAVGTLAPYGCEGCTVLGAQRPETPLRPDDQREGCPPSASAAGHPAPAVSPESAAHPVATVPVVRPVNVTATPAAAEGAAVDRPVPEHSVTDLAPWSVTGQDRDLQVHIGLRVPGARYVWDAAPGVDGVRRRLWLADEEGTSWAVVDVAEGGREASTFAVTQCGPRGLWDEVVRVQEQYEAAGRPGIDRLRLRLTPDGAGTRYQVCLA